MIQHPQSHSSGAATAWNQEQQGRSPHVSGLCCENKIDHGQHEQITSDFPWVVWLPLEHSYTTFRISSHPQLFTTGQLEWLQQACSMSRGQHFTSCYYKAPLLSLTPLFGIQRKLRACARWKANPSAFENPWWPYERNKGSFHELCKSPPIGNLGV